jgi:hypothetical protein
VGTANRGYGGFVFERLFLPLQFNHGRHIAERFKSFNRLEEDHFNYEN